MGVPCVQLDGISRAGTLCVDIFSTHPPLLLSHCIQLLVEIRILREIEFHESLGQAELVEHVFSHVAIDGLPAHVLQRVHSAQSADGLREIEVDVVVLPMASENAHGELVNCGPVPAIVDQIHERVEQREAGILKRQAEVALCVVDTDRAELVLYFESYRKNVCCAVGIARVSHEERSVGFFLQQRLGLRHGNVAVVVSNGGERRDGAQQTARVMTTARRHIEKNLQKN